MRFRVLFVSSFICIVAAFTQAGAEIVLVEEGRPHATIVIASEPSKQASDAASVLQSFIERITGADLDIKRANEEISGNRIFVGQCKKVDELGVTIPRGHSFQMDEEGFVVKTIGADLVLAGNEDWNYKGTLFAVYDFLEDDLGCRWYSPGPFGEVIPQMKTIRLGDIDRTERPSFRIRDIWYSGWMPTTTDDHRWMAEWCDRNKLTRLDLSLPGDGSITRLAPAEKYFESHPEIYATDKDGKRMRDMLCMSEPEAVRISVETIKTAFREDPTMLTFGFAPPDGHPMCYCDRCQQQFPGFNGKGFGDPSLSESWFQFANKIAEEVRKEFPERWVLTNGYANRVRPPESVKPLAANLGIQSAMLSTCTFHSIGDPKCWQRMTYKHVLDRWSSALDFILIYDYDPGKAVDNLPFPMLHNLKRDFSYFKQSGLWGFWTEGQNAWMVNHLSYYVRAKLMWNVEADVDALVQDYCKRFYGAAAEPIDKYIWALENAVDETTLHMTWGRLMFWRPILSPISDTLDTLIREAETLATTSPARERVHVLRLVHDHMMACLAMEVAAADGQFQNAIENADKMFALREDAEKIQTGLLPRSTEISADQSSSIERHRIAFGELADRAGGAKGELIVVLPREWDFKKDPEENGILEEWYLSGRTDGWSPIDTTLPWEMQGYQDEKGWSYSGMAWYRTHIDAPSIAAEKPVKLTLGGVFNRGVWVWVNGVMRNFEHGKKGKLGFYDGFLPIDADVTDLIRPGESNTIAVLVNTEPAERNPRNGFHRRAFLWTPR